MFKINSTKYALLGDFKSTARFLLVTCQRIDGGDVVTQNYIVAAHNDNYLADEHFPRETAVFRLYGEDNNLTMAPSHLRNSKRKIKDYISIGAVNDYPSSPAYPDKQIEAVVLLIKHIYNAVDTVPLCNVISRAMLTGHLSDDPGPKFPWQMLAIENAAVWYSEEIANSHRKILTKMLAQNNELPGRRTIIREFERIGYVISKVLSDRAYCNLITCFQRRFRPSLANGLMDLETCALLYSVSDQFAMK